MFYSTGGAVYSPALTDFTFMVKVRSLQLSYLYHHRTTVIRGWFWAEVYMWIINVKKICHIHSQISRKMLGKLLPWKLGV